MRAYLRSADCRLAKDFARLGRQKFIEQNGAYVSREQPDEPGFAYVSDHRQIDIPVVWHEVGDAPANGVFRAKDVRILFPWVTAWMDEATFSLVGSVVTDVPCSGTVKQALARSVSDFGAPRHVLTDNGKDYLHLMLSPEGRTFERRCLWDDDQNRELLANIYNHLGIFGRHLSRPRNPRSKRIERFFAFLSLRLDVALVGWRGRGKGDRVAACDALIAKTKEAIAAKRPVGLAHGTCMTRAEFEDLWKQFVAWDFNRERTAGRMKGRTPKEVWESCQAPIRRVGGDALWFLMLKKENRVVQKGGRVGLVFNGARVEWWHESLLELRGRRVDLRLNPDDLETILVCDPERGGALLAVAERVVKTPAYEEGEKQITRAQIERVAGANKRLIRATKDLGVAREEALAAVANMGPTEFFGMPRGAAYTSVPDLSGRALTPVQTGFEAPAKAARAGMAVASQKRGERAARRAQERDDGPLTALIQPVVKREDAEPLVPLWKDIPLTIHHLEDPE